MFLTENFNTQERKDMLQGAILMGITWPDHVMSKDKTGIPLTPNIEPEPAFE